MSSDDDNDGGVWAFDDLGGPESGDDDGDQVQKMRESF